MVYEKQHALPRLTAFFSDGPDAYVYSGQATEANYWPDPFLELKFKIENQFGLLLQHCLANYYRDGQDCVGWHRDSEIIFGQNPIIASLTCGATRKFKIRERKRDGAQKLEYNLGHGDLLIFTNEHVTDWEHCVPRTAKSVGPRLNLTFRSGK